MGMDNPQPARHVNQIPVGDLAKIIEALATLQPDGRQPISAAAAIKGRLKRPIKAALKHGVSYAQLVALLRELGVDLTTETLKGYMRESVKPASTDQTEAKMDTTKAPQEPAIASIPAASAESPIDVNTPNASGPGGGGFDHAHASPRRAAGWRGVMEPRERKPRSKKRQATEIVACRLTPHEFRAVEAAARAFGLRSAGILARRLLIDHLARPGLDLGLLRDLALTLAPEHPTPSQRKIIAQMIAHLDEGGA